MPGKLAVEPERPKALSAFEERALLREALDRNPRSAAMRLRLATLSNLLDSFEDTIALLRDPQGRSHGPAESLVLAHALLARGAPGDAQAARDLAEAAAEQALDHRQRSVALADAAKAALRLGDSTGAVARLEEALRLDPDNAAACKRLATHWLAAGLPAAVLDLTERLAAEGVGNARLLASRTLALARVGRLEAARALLNLGDFLHCEQLGSPPGWRDLRTFNAALAAELLAHPGQRRGRYGTASHETVRIDAPATGAAPAVRALLGRIGEAAARHAARVDGRAHQWVASRPERALLASWCVITQADGFEDWHTHPGGWMSGAYYVEVPLAVSAGTGEAGCLALGLPEGLAGVEASDGFGRELVRPAPGLLVLFPSFGYHRTFPHQSSGRRICVSFDLRPV